MATTLNVTSGYSGALAGEIFVQAFKKSDTINKNCITPVANSIGIGYLPKVSRTQSLTAYACGFNPTGTVTYADKSVTLLRFQVSDEICKDKFYATFQSQTSGLFAANNAVPATITDAILLSMVNNIGSLVDTAIWQGTTATSINGFLNQFAGDSDIVSVSGATAITSSNVQNELGKVYDAIPEAILGETDLVIAVSPNVARAYKKSQIGNYMVGSPVGDKELDYIGIRVESIAGLTSNTMVAYQVSNLAFLTGLLDDINKVDILDMDQTDLSGTIRTKAVFSMGVGYSFGSQIVLYKA